MRIALINYDMISPLNCNFFLFLFRVKDQNGDWVELLGSIYSPWCVTARLISGAGSDAGAKLVGAVKVPFRLGVATFDNLAISHSGKDYKLEFVVTKPAKNSLTKASPNNGQI